MQEKTSFDYITLIFDAEAALRGEKVRIEITSSNVSKLLAAHILREVVRVLEPEDEGSDMAP